MALNNRRRRQRRHAAPTPLLRQLGLGRRRVEVPLVPSGYDEPPAANRPVTSLADRARGTVAALFPHGTPGLPPLDWQYGEGTATAQVDPGLVVDAARNVLLAYAAHMGAEVQQQQVGERLLLRTARAFDGVLVTVWADVTPDPGPVPDQPHMALPPSQLEMDAYRAATGQEHPHANPDEGAEPHPADGVLDVPTEQGGAA